MVSAPAIFVSLFTACHVYEDTTVEVIRCPTIDADTVMIPDWEHTPNDSVEY